MTTIFDRPWYKKNDFENDNIIESKYSSFIYNKEAIDRIMKDDNSVIEELYNIANSLVVENPIVFYMSNKDVSYTDGHHIVIANKESFSDINDNHSKFDIEVNKKSLEKKEKAGIKLTSTLGAITFSNSKSSSESNTGGIVGLGKKKKKKKNQ